MKIYTAKHTFLFTLLLLATLPGLAQKQVTGKYWQVDYPASDKTNELQIAVTYKIWLPDHAKKIRGVIIHQHGAGTTAANAGRTASEDLQWQAFASKWDCALLGPSYHVLNEKITDTVGGAELWFDPRRGSDKALLKALQELGIQSGHPELNNAPWCLWGHSGGGIWADLLSMQYPQRIVAIWMRSGSVFMMKNVTSIPQPVTVPEAVFAIPSMLNPGIGERNNRVGIGNLVTFNAYRGSGAFIGFAEDPLSGHDCGYSRSLAIPFFDACLAMRLPDPKSKDQSLRPVDTGSAWLASLADKTAWPAKDYKGPHNEAVWLPNEKVAKAWMEYVKTGAVKDHTPPPAPFDVKVVRNAAGFAQLTWNTTADLESGIGGFIILKDGQELAQLPRKPKTVSGHPLFQFGEVNYYHDTPEYPLPQMQYTDSTTSSHQYAVIAVNSDGARSTPTSAKNKTE